jgi:hypothetical protein
MDEDLEHLGKSVEAQLRDARSPSSLARRGLGEEFRGRCHNPG